MQGNAAEVIVVGGGLAGLTAAAYLARAGRQVTLFESGTLGGRAATQDFNGYLFNEGPHALYAAGHGRQVLDDLGVPYQGALAVTESPRALIGGKLHDLPRSAAALVTTRALSLGAKVEAAQVFQRMSTLDASALDHTPMGEWIEREVRSEEVKNLVRALIRVSTYGNTPEIESAGADLAQFQLGAQGVLYLDGGWQTMVEGLGAAAVAAGARIHPNVRVRSVAPAGEAYRVSLGEGEELTARQVVLAVRPAVAAALVPGSPVLSAWSEQAVPARAACLDLGLRTLPEPKVQFVLGLDTPLYFSVHTRAARLAPEGGALVQVARYLGSQPPADPRATEKELEDLMDLAQPGWREHVAERRYLPNMAVHYWVPTAATGGLKGRPGPAVPDYPGLYVAGDWVGPEGMLADTALASGRRAAGLILETAGKEREPEYALH